MNLVLAIQTYGAGSAALERHWPFFLRAGADRLVVITTEDEHCWVPDEVDSVAISRSGYIDGMHLPIRWLRTLEFLISLEVPFVGLLEYDNVPLRSFLPLEKGFTANLTGGKPAGCHCNQFHHMPHLMDRETAIRMWMTGWALIRSGRPCDVSPDCFVGQLVEMTGVQHHPFDLYTQNTIKEPKHIEEAREAVKRGCVAIHGVKSEEVLQQILS